ncbi:hypothetical protein ES708_27372 [subsurface metagenome]
MDLNNQIFRFPFPSTGIVLSEKYPIIGSLIAFVIAKINCANPNRRAGNNRKSV